MNKKLLIFLSMLCIFFYVDDVKAETNYYTDDGDMFRLVFDDTPLRNFVKNDFALTYSEIDLQGYEIAKLTSTSNNSKYTFINGFAKDKDLNIMIYETSEEWQANNNEKYIAFILPDYIAGNTNSTQPKIYENIKVVKYESSGTFLGYYYKGDYYYLSSYGVNQLNFNKSSGKKVSNTLISYGSGNTELIIAVDKNGNITRKTDLHNTNSSLVQEITGKANRNLIYSSLDVYNNAGTQIVTPKEEFETRNITSNYSLTCDEDYPYIYDIHFNISDLKANDKVVIDYNDDSILLNETLIEEKKSFSIENAKTGNYNIKVYDDSGELIHENSFYIKVDSDVQIDVSDEDININSDDDVSTILNKNNIFLNKALVIVTPLIQIIITFYNNLPTFLKLALISIFISLLIYLLVRRLT